MRIISVSYLPFMNSERINLSAGKRNISAALYDVDELLASGRKLAFEFLPEEFTLPELQRIYEIFLGKKLYKVGFRRKIMPMIEETDRMTSGDAHRPSKYYRLREDIDQVKRGGININRKDNNGFTALHYAQQHPLEVKKL